MLTEDEARKKWCPMVRLAEATAPPGYPSRNRGTLDDDAHPLCRCIASGCMAWRSGEDKRDVIARIQDETGETRVNLVRDYRARTGAGLKEAMDAVNAEFPPRQVGYCGAFGRPGDV